MEVEALVWYEALLPAVGIAMLVRAEALLIGPYWAWIELLPSLDEDANSRKLRRWSIVRRTAVPGVIAFGMVNLWRRVYTESDVVVVAVIAAGLLLWPIVVHGLPLGVMARDWELLIIYGALIASFASSAWIGARTAGWVHREYGDFGSFLRQEALGFGLGLLVAAFAGGIIDSISRKASSREDG